MTCLFSASLHITIYCTHTQTKSMFDGPIIWPSNPQAFQNWSWGISKKKAWNKTQTLHHAAVSGLCIAAAGNEPCYKLLTLLLGSVLTSVADWLLRCRGVRGGIKEIKNQNQSIRAGSFTYLMDFALVMIVIIFTSQSSVTDRRRFVCLVAAVATHSHRPLMLACSSCDFFLKLCPCSRSPFLKSLRVRPRPLTSSTTPPSTCSPTLASVPQHSPCLPTPTTPCPYRWERGWEEELRGPIFFW